MSKSKYNTYTREFPMTLDRDKPLPGERTNEVGFTSPLPEVDKEYYTEDSKPLGTVETKTVIPDALNLRTEPNGNVIRCLKKGDTVAILSKSEDDAWYQVKTETGEGWVMSKYLE